MAAGEEEQNKEERKGFAGLSSLVSDVDTSLPPAAKQEAESPVAASNAPGRAASASPQPEPQPTQPKQQPYQAPSQPNSGSFTGKWVLGIVAVIGVLWLIGEADKIPSSPAPSYSPPARSTTPSYSAAPAQPQFPTRLDETKPPVGQDLVFSTSQIRYCLAEDIRMEAARAVLNNYSDSDVDRFNAMVADYNSRCGSFRYRSGVLESARRDVEPYRSQLQAEGRSRFARSPSTGAPATPAPARPTPDETVRAVQQRLNELGYNPGPADGLMGPRTRAAIISFQQAQGLAATGLAEQAVLSQMQQAAPRTQSTWVEPLSPPSSPERPPHQSTSGGKPDLSEISASERAAIENACGYHQRNSGPGEYYNCLRRQLTVLASSGGRPDLSRASSSEQAAIERACGYHQRNSGPGEYYNCLRRQLTVLASSGGRPDLSRASSSEQAAIERACGYHQRNSGPGEYYNCLRRQLTVLASSGGRPDLSRASSSEQAAIERACGYHQRNSGPGDYYRCLRSEMAKLGYR